MQVKAVSSSFLAW